MVYAPCYNLPMPKPTSKPNVYEMVTEKIIAQLKAGVVPWHKPWSASFQAPRNLLTGKSYRGINIFLLSLAGYDSPYWLTFKQALELGGNVKKGEKGTVAVFWKAREIAIEGEEGEEQTRRVPVLRYFTVFNLSQCENIEALPTEAPRTAPSPIAACEEIVACYQGRPTSDHGGDRACYSPLKDHISMPEPKTFDSMAHYYATLFHEFAHSTGHQKRLGRPGIVDFDTFGSHQYSKEELVAEMGAAFLAARAGIDAEGLLDNSAAYIRSWLQKLENDQKMVVQAAAQAQRAADLILGVKWDEKPADTDEKREAA